MKGEIGGGPHSGGAEAPVDRGGRLEADSSCA
jgi:hypothetical protein